MSKYYKTKRGRIEILSLLINFKEKHWLYHWYWRAYSVEQSFQKIPLQYDIIL